jgi:hypothetical protein
MDPLSITTGCLALLTAVGQTSVLITNFVRGCREAWSDLSAITVELSQLQLVLELLKEDTAVSDNQVIPESLQAQILSIITNCSSVVTKITTVLQNHGGKSSAAKWVMFGKAEVAGLRMSLEAHRGALNLVLELVSVSLSRAVKEDTSAIRNDIHEIRQDTSQIPQIMEEMARLRAIVAAGAGGSNYVLQQYFDSLSSYAETVCNDVDWDTDGSIRSTSRPASRAGELSMTGRTDDPPRSGLAEVLVDSNVNSVLSSNPSPPSAASADAHQNVEQAARPITPSLSGPSLSPGCNSLGRQLEELGIEGKDKAVSSGPSSSTNGSRLPSQESTSIAPCLTSPRHSFDSSRRLPPLSTSAPVLPETVLSESALAETSADAQQEPSTTSQRQGSGVDDSYASNNLIDPGLTTLSRRLDSLVNESSEEYDPYRFIPQHRAPASSNVHVLLQPEVSQLGAVSQPQICSNQISDNLPSVTSEVKVGTDKAEPDNRLGGELSKTSISKQLKPRRFGFTADPRPELKRKLVIVGDGAVGKTCLYR